MKTDEIASLLRELEQAFGDLPLPPDDDLVKDNSDSNLECKQVRAKFRGRHWRSLSIDDLENEADSLYSFSPVGFRFFLPSFIRVALTDYDRADLIPRYIVWALAPPEDTGTWDQRRDSYVRAALDHGIPEGVVDMLKPPGGEDLSISHRLRVNRLSLDQKRSVIGFISFLRKHHAGDFRLADLKRAEEALQD